MLFQIPPVLRSEPKLPAKAGAGGEESLVMWRSTTHMNVYLNQTNSIVNFAVNYLEGVYGKDHEIVRFGIKV